MAGRSQKAAEKSQRMTAALEKMPWIRAAGTQAVCWAKAKGMGSLVMACKSLTLETAVQEQRVPFGLAVTNIKSPRGGEWCRVI